MRGLPLNIYRPAHASGSNGGLSTRVDKVTLIGIRDLRPGHDSAVQPLDQHSQVREATDDAPAVVLVRRYIRGEYVHIEPAADAHLNYMFGGTYVATSDSRFSELPGVQHAVSFHDRVERSTDRV